MKAFNRLAKLKPGTKARPASKEIKGFVYINIARWEQDRMRALADCFGINLALFLRLAVHDAQEKVERATGISREQALKMTRKERLAFGARWREMLHRIGGRFGKEVTN